MKQWAHLQLPSWNCTTTPAMKVGTTICSATQTVVPWSVLPARVTYINEGAEEFEGGTGAHAAGLVGAGCPGVRARCLFSMCAHGRKQARGRNIHLDNACATVAAQYNVAQVCAVVCVLITNTYVMHACLIAADLFHAAGCCSCGLCAGKRFAVGMCSLEGHQLAGEERFAVDMLPDGSVWYVGTWPVQQGIICISARFSIASAEHGGAVIQLVSAQSAHLRLPCAGTASIMSIMCLMEWLAQLPAHLIESPFLLLPFDVQV